MLAKKETINQLKYAIQALSLEAEGQLASFPEYVVVTDELLLEFHNWRNTAITNYPEYFSPEQLGILNDIDVLTNRYELGNSNRSIAEELKIFSFWKELRALAKEALVKFNWISKIPPNDRATYIKA